MKAGAGAAPAPKAKAASAITNYVNPGPAMLHNYADMFTGLINSECLEKTLADAYTYIAGLGDMTPAGVQVASRPMPEIKKLMSTNK